MKRFAADVRHGDAPRPDRDSRRAGFTLVELLVVMAVVSLLVAILLPALSAARERAYLTQCSANVRQWGLAMIMYDEVYGAFPSAIEETYSMRASHPGGPSVHAALRDEFGLRGNVAYCPNAPDRTGNNQVADLAARWKSNTAERETGWHHISGWGDHTGSTRVNGWNPARFSENDHGYLPAASLTKPYSIGNRPKLQHSKQFLMIDRVWVGNGGGRLARVNHPRVTPHKDTPAKGGNMLFMDGHVAWQDYSAGAWRVFSNSGFQIFISSIEAPPGAYKMP